MKSPLMTSNPKYIFDDWLGTNLSNYSNVLLCFPNNACLMSVFSLINYIGGKYITSNITRIKISTAKR